MIRELGLSFAVVAALVGWSEDRLSKGLRGVRQLSNEEGAELMNALHRLSEVRDGLVPLMWDSRSAKHIQMLLDAFEGLSSEQIQSRVANIFEVHE
jgi:hypothetical protein